ncbi:hypothetical protein AHAS_Ahas18G0169000 [Arachis hypogaea]
MRLLNEKFEKMSEAKKAIIRELRFGGLMNIPSMNVLHKLLKELANSFNLDKNKLDTRHGDLFSDKVIFKKLSEENKEIFRRFQGKTLKNLTDQVMDIGVDNDQDRLMFKRIFILYIQMAFLLPTDVGKSISYKLTGKCTGLYQVVITHRSEVDPTEIDGSSNFNKKEEGIPRLPWVSHWNRELLVARIRAEINGHMTQRKQQKEGNNPPGLLKKWYPEKENRFWRIPFQKLKVNPTMTLHNPSNLLKAHLQSHQLHLKLSYMSTHNNPPPEATAPLMMIANTASYVPKQFLAPSFSFGFTDSSQEETLTQEGTNEYEPVCILNAQQPLELSKIHFASLKASSYIEAEIVTTMCLILNQQNIRVFQEEIYYLPLTIVNMAIGNHEGGECLQPKTKKPFKIEDYKRFIPFLDLKKLASYPYIFAPVCYVEHWWMWVADVRKKKFYILDPYHKTYPFEPRIKLNKFVGYVISRMSYDYAIYAEVDHFRVEYASQILFHEMNRDRDTAIRESEAIRLSKPSTHWYFTWAATKSYVTANLLNVELETCSTTSYTEEPRAKFVDLVMQFTFL